MYNLMLSKMNKRFFLFLFLAVLFILLSPLNFDLLTNAQGQISVPRSYYEPGPRAVGLFQSISAWPFVPWFYPHTFFDGSVSGCSNPDPYPPGGRYLYRLQRNQVIRMWFNSIEVYDQGQFNFQPRSVLALGEYCQDLPMYGRNGSAFVELPYGNASYFVIVENPPPGYECNAIDLFEINADGEIYIGSSAFIYRPGRSGCVSESFFVYPRSYNTQIGFRVNFMPMPRSPINLNVELVNLGGDLAFRVTWTDMSINETNYVLWVTDLSGSQVFYRNENIPPNTQEWYISGVDAQSFLDGRSYFFHLNSKNTSFVNNSLYVNLPILQADSDGYCQRWINGRQNWGVCSTWASNYRSDGTFYGDQGPSRVQFTYENPPSCIITLNGGRLIAGESSSISPAINVQPNTSQVVQVVFTRIGGNSANICGEGNSVCVDPTVNRVTDLNSVFRFIITGVSSGQTRVRAEATVRGLNGRTATCSSEADFEVTNPPAWWQVMNGNVISNGNVSSLIPTYCNNYLPSCVPLLIRDTVVSSPGIVISKDLNLGGGAVSSTNRSVRIAQDIAYSMNSFDVLEKALLKTGFAYRSDIPDFSTPSSNSRDGYEYYFYDGTLVPSISIGPIDIGDRRVVLLARNASLRIEGNVNLNDGVGFFMAVVQRDIFVGDNIGGFGTSPHIEGILVSGGRFRSSSSGVSTQLRLRGVLVSNDSPVLNRSLPNNSMGPAELFQFAPDLYLRIPTNLTVHRLRWREADP